MGINEPTRPHYSHGRCQSRHLPTRQHRRCHATVRESNAVISHSARPFWHIVRTIVRSIFTTSSNTVDHHHVHPRRSRGISNDHPAKIFTPCEILDRSLWQLHGDRRGFHHEPDRRRRKDLSKIVQDAAVHHPRTRTTMRATTDKSPVTIIITQILFNLASR